MKHLMDVNVTVGVLRADSQLHSTARAWSMGNAGRASDVMALPQTLVGAVRVLTNERIWAQTPTPAEATAAVTELVQGAHVQVVGSSAGSWSQFQALVEAVEMHYRGVSDALRVAQARAMEARLRLGRRTTVRRGSTWGVTFHLDQAQRRDGMPAPLDQPLAHQRAGGGSP